MESFLMNYNKCEENISVLKKKLKLQFIYSHKKSGSFKISWFQSLTKKQWQDNRFSVKGSQYKWEKAI